MRARLPSTELSAVLPAMMWMACAAPVDPMPDAPPSPNCIAATEHSDLAWIQERIFTPTCSAFEACHNDGEDPAAGLSLTAGMSHDSLVAQPSSLFPTRTLVTPGSPEDSYLMVVLGSFDGPLPDDGTMPLNNPILCVQQREAIARWIAAGALP
ncbi:MAG: hypothetical protein IPL79_03280 [Myxococcales bacterium]|nr:hypothetical protein [Myxococcales bacterium]